METFILGTGGMMPLPGRYLTSVLLRREGDLFLFDCGEGTQISLRSLNLRWKKINTIFISHTHADHITGLPGILMLSAQVDRTEPLVIIGPPKIREYVETSREVLDMYINYDIEIREIEKPSVSQVVYEGEGYKVRSFPLKHSKVCVGYTLEEDPRPGIFYPEKAKEAGIPVGPLWSKLQSGEDVVLNDGKVIHPQDVMGMERKGRKFSFVTDTLYRESISKEVTGSDLLICEGMFEKELADSAKEKKHLTAYQAGLIASKAGGVKKMGLIHYSPRYTEKQLRRLKKEAKENFPETFLCRDQMVLEIPNNE
ncbi:ribonuclease Z [Spirochaeta isovalerica]|uniref:Ribonuclease Z n=1 Tax=Spirochaeta isovalerica TaxID=150 RepID=A0A841R6S8_9SPIO|nr:ribonuclease Z [Spirochaeta isovalerica]MBB6478907.1 ribonuclease Z [Spirochaeta isovalerica]